MPTADTKQTDSNSVVLPPDFDIVFSSNQLLSNLRLTSPSLGSDTRRADVDHLESLLSETTELSTAVVRHFRACTEEAANELREANAMCDSLGTLLTAVKRGLEVPDQSTIRGKKRNRDSDESQLTAVSTDSGYLEVANLKRRTLADFLPPTEQPSFKPVHYRHVAVAADLPVLEVSEVGGSRPFVWPEWLDSFMTNSESSPTSSTSHATNFMDEIERGLSMLELGTEGKIGNSMVEAAKFRAKKKTRDEVVGREESDNEKTAGRRHAANLRKRESGTSKLKAWLKRKIMPERSLKLEIVWDIEDDGRIGREVKNETIPPDHVGQQIVSIHPSFQIALAAASRDLDSIRWSATSVSRTFLSVMCTHNGNGSLNKRYRLIIS